MNQTTSTLHAAGSLTAGAALAVMALFAIRVWMPDIYAEMGDIEKQAITLLVAVGAQRIYSLFGPKGAMQPPADPPAQEDTE